MSEGLRFVALDLSTTAAGIAWNCDRHGANKVGCRTVHTPAPMPLHQRIHRVLEDVEVAIRCKPHLVVVEGSFVRGSVSDGMLLMLRGVILHWLWSRRQRIPYVDVAPKTLKVWATGNGDATKTAVKAAMIAAYGRLCHIATTDEADAVALLSMGAAAYGQPLAVVPEPGRRALKVPRWPDLATETGPVVPVTGGPR